MRRYCAALDQMITAKKVMAGSTWTKEEPTVQGLASPFLAAPHTEGTRPPKTGGQTISPFVPKDEAPRHLRAELKVIRQSYLSAKQRMVQRYMSPEKIDRLKVQFKSLSLKDEESLEA